MTTKVYVQYQEAEYQHMFREHGWEITYDYTEADVICFTGGADVSPAMYLEENTASSCDVQLDLESVGLWTRTRDKMHVGICRGGQFLNVMQGGSMVQHIDGHGLWDTHPVEYLREVYNVTSTHHQEMVPNEGTHAVYASDNVVECIMYPDALCFQPHPEYSGADETKELFFNILEDYYGYR